MYIHIIIKLCYHDIWVYFHDNFDIHSTPYFHDSIVDWLNNTCTTAPEKYRHCHFEVTNLMFISTVSKNVSICLN